MLALVLIAAAVLLGYGIAKGSLLALVIIPAVLLAMATVAWPLTALTVMLAYVPVESFLLKWVPGGQGGVLSLAPEIILFLAASSAFLRGVSGRHSRGRTVLLLWIGAFVVIGLLSGWLAGTPTIDTLWWVRNNVRYMSAAIIVGALGSREWWVRRVALIVAGSSIVQFFVALAQLVGGSAVISFFTPASIVVGGRQFVNYSAAPLGGISGTLSYYNNFGLFSACSCAVCMGALATIGGDEKLARSVSPTSKNVLLAGALLAAASTLLSASRQSLIALLVAGAVIALVVGIRRVGARLLPIAVLSAVFAGAAFLMPSLIGSLSWIPRRFSEAMQRSYLSQSLATDRLFVISRVLPAVLSKNPLLGIGPGSVTSMAKLNTMASELSLSAEGIYYAQDVGWVSAMIQTGLLGFGALVTLMSGLAWTARKRFVSGDLDRGALATVIAVLIILVIGMVASSPMMMRPVSLLVWTAAGLSLGGYRAEDGSVADA